MALGSHTQHEDHAHSHGPSCGHASIEHERGRGRPQRDGVAQMER